MTSKNTNKVSQISQVSNKSHKRYTSNEVMLGFLKQISARLISFLGTLDDGHTDCVGNAVNARQENHEKDKNRIVQES